jgi:hypothetical protein
MLERSEASQGGVYIDIFTFLHLSQYSEIGSGSPPQMEDGFFENVL